jgi:hypothetical protein
MNHLYRRGAMMSNETHAVLTGPITGTVTTEDGTEIDVSAAYALVDSLEKAQEVAFLIGERYAEEGHPDDVEKDSNGNLVQRPFEHKVDKKFAKHPGRHKGKPAGTARKG